MFDNLSERLEAAFKQLKGEGRINEINIAATVKEIRRAAPRDRPTWDSYRSMSN